MVLAEHLRARRERASGETWPEHSLCARRQCLPLPSGGEVERSAEPLSRMHDCELN